MCNVCMPVSDEVNATDEFADQLLDMLNQGALSLMVSIGHRTGLFDSMAELASPESSGTFLMQDIRASSHLEKNLEHPIAPLLYTLSTMHCMTVSLAQGGAGLGTMWVRNWRWKCWAKLGLMQLMFISLNMIFRIIFMLCVKPLTSI